MVKMDATRAESGGSALHILGEKTVKLTYLCS